jgi:hypothetical protein
MPEHSQNNPMTPLEVWAAIDQISLLIEHGQVCAESVQQSLEFLRLKVQYVLLDLEATRRENGYLRRMLEQQGRDET